MGTDGLNKIFEVFGKSIKLCVQNQTFINPNAERSADTGCDLLVQYLSSCLPSSSCYG